MLKAKITSVTKEILQEDNSTHLKVEFNIVDGDDIVQSKKVGFPLGTTEKAICAELGKAVRLYKAELAAAKKQTELDKQHAEADETIKNLKGLEVDEKEPEFKEKKDETESKEELK